MKDWVVDWGITSNLVLQTLLSRMLISIPLINVKVFIDDTTLFRNDITLVNIGGDDVFFMEFLSPSLWNTIFNLIFYHVLVRALGQGSCKGLLMQLVKFVVELGNHLLDFCGFLLSEDFLEDCCLEVSL